MVARKAQGLWLATWPLLFLGANYRTENFLVTAPTAELARQIGDAAEMYRRDLAIEWLGRQLPAWDERCPIRAEVHDRLPAGGQTSFYFVAGRPRGWQMILQGSRERVLDSVLPHEITHTIFATHFGRPLPRWADEGACTTVEHPSERAKQEKWLVEFLSSRPSRGIPFNVMFQMRDYPSDILPLYSQGYALAEFLIAQGGKQKFVKYLESGMKSENWTQTTLQHYGYPSLSALQVAWVEWVARGRPSPVPEDLVGTPALPSDVSLVAQTDEAVGRPAARTTGTDDTLGWYARQSAARSASHSGPKGAELKQHLEPIARQLTRPINPQRIELLVLEPERAAPLADSPAGTLRR